MGHLTDEVASVDQGEYLVEGGSMTHLQGRRFNQQKYQLSQDITNVKQTSMRLNNSSLRALVEIK